MKFSLEKTEFQKGVFIASRAIAGNSTLPILSHILLRAENNKLYFTSTNLEIAIQYFIPAEVFNEGSITLPARLLQSYIPLLKDEPLKIGVEEGNTLHIVSSDSKTQMKGLKPEDFPSIPQVARMCELRLPVKKFQEALGEVVFSASATSTRPILSGVCFQGKGDTLTLVSTDSFRLSEKILTLEKPLEEEIHAIIPGRTLTELSRLLSETEEEYISLILSDKQILFSFGNIQFTSRLIDGQFPNYKQILPQKSTTTVSLDKGILSLALKRVELFAKENKNNIKFHFLPAEKKVIITTDATQIGTNESEVELTGEGEENQIALDGSYILDVLQALPSGNIHIKIDHSKAPALFLHSDHPDYKHIIMPLQLS